MIKKGNKIFWSKSYIAEKNLNLISCSNNEIWSSNRKSKKKKILIGEHDSEVSALLVIHSKKTLISAGWDASIKIYIHKKTITFECVHILTRHSNAVTCLFYDESVNGDEFVSGSFDSTIKIWSISKGLILRSVELNHSCWFDYLHVFSNRREMITADCNGENRIKLWDTQLGSCKKIVYLNRGVFSVLSWNNELIIIGSYMEIYIYNILTFKCKRVFKECHRGEIKCLIKLQNKGYASKSKYGDNKSDALLASAGGIGDFCIKIWNPFGGQCLKTIEARNQITSVCFVESRGQIVFSCIDGAIKLYDLNKKSNETIKVIQKRFHKAEIKFLINF